jgi:hypothetical protein
VVTSTTRCAAISPTSSMNAAMDAASMSFVGSSNSMTGGAAIKAAASSSLRAVPADNVPNGASRNAPSPSRWVTHAAYAASRRLAGYIEAMNSNNNPERIHGMSGGVFGASTTRASR